MNKFELPNPDWLEQGLRLHAPSMWGIDKSGWQKDKTVIREWHKKLTEFNNNFEKDKTMFNKFSDNSFRVIEVEPQQFELMTDQSLNCVFVRSNQCEVDDKIIIQCGDAALIADVIDIHKSTYDTSKDIVAFYLSDL